MIALFSSSKVYKAKHVNTSQFRTSILFRLKLSSTPQIDNAPRTYLHEDPRSCAVLLRRMWLRSACRRILPRESCDLKTTTGGVVSSLSLIFREGKVVVIRRCSCCEPSVDTIPAKVCLPLGGLTRSPSSKGHQELSLSQDHTRNFSRVILACKSGCCCFRPEVERWRRELF